MAQTTLKLRIVHARRTRLRIWAGAGILRLAALVMGCNIDVSSETKPT